MGGIQGWHIAILVILVILLFGAPKLPQLAKSMGQSMRIFKSEVKTMREDDSRDAQGETDGDAEDTSPGHRTVEGRVIDPRDRRQTPREGYEHRGDRG